VAGGLKHGIGFPDAGHGTEKDLEFSAAGFLGLARFKSWSGSGLFSIPYLIHLSMI